MARRRTPTEGPPDEPPAYEVGYGRPPKHSRFQAGQSGNPRGRAPGARSLRADLEAELRAEVAVSENGKTAVMTKQLLAIKALVNKAARGDARALTTLLDQINRHAIGEQEGGSVAPVSTSDEAILRDFLQRHGEGRA